MNSFIDQKNSNRSGFTLLEAMVSLVILSAAAAALLQIVTLCSHQRRATEQRSAAIEEAANLMEHIAAFSWENTDAEHVGMLFLSEETARRLPGAKLTIQIETPQPDSASEDASNTLKAKQIAIEIVWDGSVSDHSKSVRLSSWKYRPREVQP